MIVTFWTHARGGETPDLLARVAVTDAGVDWQVPNTNLQGELDGHWFDDLDGKFDQENMDHWRALPQIYNSWTTWAQIDEEVQKAGPRMTPHQRQVRAACDQLVEDLQGEMLTELQRLWRDLFVRLRRLETQRTPEPLHKGHLKKSSYMDVNLWWEFQNRTKKRLVEAIKSGVVTLTAINAAFLAQRIGHALVIDAEQFAADYEHLLGMRITQVAQSLQREVARKVVTWYNTPGMTLKELVAELQPRFGLSRAKLIATTEITALNSGVQEKIAGSLGINVWWWQTRRDQSVCEKPMTGPDGRRWNGCKALHGQVFRVGQHMPPHGSHPGCRCDAVLIIPTFGKMEKAWNEADHPRGQPGNAGQFGPGGGGVDQGMPGKPEHRIKPGVGGHGASAGGGGPHRPGRPEGKPARPPVKPAPKPEPKPTPKPEVKPPVVVPPPPPPPKPTPSVVAVKPAPKPEPKPEPAPKKGPAPAHYSTGAEARTHLAASKPDMDKAIGSVDVEMEALTATVKPMLKDLDDLKRKVKYSFGEERSKLIVQHNELAVKANEIIHKKIALRKKADAASQKIVAVHRKALQVDTPCTIKPRWGKIGTARQLVAQNGIDEFEKLVHDAVIFPSKQQVSIHAGRGRSSYNAFTRSIEFASGGDVTALIHELGHHIGHSNPDARAAVRAFYMRRTAGEKEVSLGEATGLRFGRGETTRPDKFFDPYVGKEYPDGETEVLSMGLEEYFHDPVTFAEKDPEHFDLIFDIVHGKYNGVK